MTTKKKLKRKDLISGRHYYQCNPKTKHIDIVEYRMHGNSPVVFNIGLEQEDLVDESYDDLFFIEVKRPEGLEAWTL